MTSTTCPTCGDLCGMREFGWEPSSAHVTLAAVRASLTEYEATCDWRELVRALRNIFDGGDGHEWVDGATVVTRPGSEETDG